MRAVLLLLIAAYQRLVSPCLPAACRYTPTCSRYAADAIRLHGAVHGVRLAVGRLLRCRPFGGGGWDPVPPTLPSRRERRASRSRA